MLRRTSSLLGLGILVPTRAYISIGRPLSRIAGERAAFFLGEARASSRLLGSASDDTPPVFSLPISELPYSAVLVNVSDLEGSLPDLFECESSSSSSSGGGSGASELPLMGRLETLVAELTLAGFTSLWLRVPLHRSEIAGAAAARCAFSLHHADAEEGDIVLTKWLRHDFDSKVPPYPNTQVCERQYSLLTLDPCAFKLF